MEPFVKKNAGRLQLHWWIVAGVAAAFFVWSFDLVPRVRSAATGTIAQSKRSEKASARKKPNAATFEEEWPLDFDSDEQDAGETSPFALEEPSEETSEHRHAAANESGEMTEPSGDEDAREITAAGSHRARRDSRIAPASFDVSASKKVPTPNALQKQASVLPADVAQKLRQVDQWLQEDQILNAHAELSRIYWKHPEFRGLIQEEIDQTAAVIFTMSDRQFSQPHFVEYGETLEAIAKKYDVPWEYLAMLNRVTPEKLQAGQELKVVRGPFGAVVDLDEFTLTVHAHGWYINHYSVGIGADEKTPLGEFAVQDKLENPTWYNPDGGIVEPDDPENPLGEYWIGLGNHIGIHGTNDSGTIGKAASRGCIHLGDDDIAEVFSLLSPGSKVLIRE